MYIKDIFKGKYDVFSKILNKSHDKFFLQVLNILKLRINIFQTVNILFDNKIIMISYFSNIYKLLSQSFFFCNFWGKISYIGNCFKVDDSSYSPGDI